MAKSPIILVIEDDEAVQETVDIILSLEGYTVIRAANGEEGVLFAKRHLPAAIILDINLPKMSGYMVSTLLAKDNALKKIPLILLTGIAQMAGHVNLTVPGVHSKLSKPFSNEELVKIIKKLAPHR